MATVGDLITEIRLRVGDTGSAELTDSQMISFINMAARDARNSGWLLRYQTQGSTADNSTYGSIVDLSSTVFAYVSRVMTQRRDNGPFEDELPGAYWWITDDAKLVFNPGLFKPKAGTPVLLLGQKRPSLYTATGDTVDPGMESFLRERASAYALRLLAAGRSEFAQYRQQEAELAFRDSELLLARHPQEFRVLPNSKLVPGR